MAVLDAIGRFSGRALRSRVVPWTLAAVLAAVAAVALWSWRHARNDDVRREEVEAVAREFLVALTNFEAGTIERDVAEMRRFAVGDFADQLQESFDEEAIRTIKQAEASSVGTIEALFVQSISEGAASAFGVVNEKVTNNLSRRPRTEILRLDIQLIETPDGWKVHEVEILQTPGPIPIPGA